MLYRMAKKRIAKKDAWPSPHFELIVNARDVTTGKTRTLKGKDAEAHLKKRIEQHKELDEGS